MTRAFTDIAQLIGQLIPPWMLIPLVVILALLALPFWLRSIRTKQIAGRVRRMVRAEGDAHSALFDEVLGIAGERPALLLAAIEQAIRYDQRALRDAAMARLEANGDATEELARIRSKLVPEPKPVPHPLEVAVNVERLLSEGMFDTARTRLDEARARYPDDPDLTALSARVDAAREQA